MEFEKIYNKGQAKLFRNQQIENLTKSHPIVIWMLYMPVVLLLPRYSFPTNDSFSLGTIFLFIGGMFFWTFTEYILHRFVFHSHPENDEGKRIKYLIHGNHHEYPRDKERLFMPPIPSVILSSCFLFLFYFIMGINAFAFFPGFLFGYLIYGSMHYAIHAWNPPFKWMKSLWRNHHLHHYKYEDKGFGVSTTLWDRVFGTMVNLKNEVDDKEKIKELMY